jgi:2-(1,2-epoxy-1,2-dihydrophenyl)acetyl-CoA isomerase
MLMPQEVPAPTPPFDSGIAVDTGTAFVRAGLVGRVGIIELYQPERRNALHNEMYDAVPELLTQFENNPDVGSVIITGAGNGFCSGGDVQAGAARTPEGQVIPPNDLAHDARMVVRMQSSPLIVVAALPGAAVGAGLSIALAADLRIASASALLIGGWGKLGFSGDFGGAWFLTKLVGPAKAMELLLENTTLSAQTAREIGLINRVVPDNELRASALAWATLIAESSRPANMFMKQNVQDSLRLPLAEFIPIESKRMRDSRDTPEHKEAVRRWLAEAKAKRAERAAKA